MTFSRYLPVEKAKNMTEIQSNLKDVLSSLPEGVSLAAVSKFHPDSMIMEAYETGFRVFAESRPQELVGKYERLPKDIRWHFIGHLQRNKVKDVVGKVELIHSVDSVRLLEAIADESVRQGVTTDILLEVFVASETTKQGFSPDEIRSLFRTMYPSVRIRGLMAMATFTDDREQIKREFMTVKNLFDEISGGDISILSMGMSDDYDIAVKCGSNLARVGSKIFGVRGV